MGAVPPSSTRDTLAFAPPATAILFRSAVSAAKAAVRLTGLGVGDGEGLGDGLGLGVTIATGVGDGVPRLPTRTSGTTPGNTTTTKSPESTRSTTTDSPAPASFSTRTRRGAVMKSYAIPCKAWASTRRIPQAGAIISAAKTGATYTDLNFPLRRRGRSRGTGRPNPGRS